MRLKKIKLAGFKSFVDPTTIPLPSSLIGIVGPNGCGKSNVIDAVRWVMGESSAKNLRGDSMADVIFNGAAGRKPVGHAAVELVFDNSAGSLGGEYASYGEIAIRRQVSRDGQSLYFLNNTRCRRKDITDIFLGTGLGPRSYAIIEQGTISRLIEAKPDELRVFLEEAAGISKYKERRRETETRMRHTHENLNRITDIRDELEKRLQTLQRQAKAAERYKELKQEERLVKAQLQTLRWSALDQETLQREKQIQSLETRLEAQVAVLRNVEANIEQRREQHNEESEAFNKVQAGAYEVGAEIARLEQAIQHAKDTREQQQHDLQEVEKAWREVQAHLTADRGLINQLSMSLSENEQALNEARQLEQRSGQALDEAEEAMHAWQQAWDEFNARAAAQLQAAEVERARIDHLEQHIAQLHDRLKRLDGELGGLMPQPLEEELAVAAAGKQELDVTLESIQASLSRDLDSLSAERQRQQTLNSELNVLRAELNSAQGRYASLEALQEESLGKGAVTVTAWLAEHGLSDAVRLAQKIKVDAGWERAVEIALGHALEAVCVDDMAGAAQWLQGLEQGEVEFFDTNVAGAAAPRRGDAPALLDRVQAPWRLDGLLGDVYVAESLADALSLRSRLGVAESVITRDGVWIGNGWLRAVRSPDEQSSVLIRERALHDMSAQIDTLDGRVGALQQQAEQSGRAIRDMEQGREGLQSRMRDVANRRAELQAQFSAKQERLAQIGARDQRLRHEISEVRDDLARDEHERVSAAGRLQDALAATADHSAQREQLLLQRDDKRRVLESIRHQARSDREARHQVDLRVESTRAQLHSTRDNLEKMQGQLNHLTHRREELGAALATGGSPIELMGGELETLLGRRLEVDEQLAAARRRLTEVDHQLRELAEKRNLAEREVEMVRNDLDGARLSSQEIKVRRQTLEEQIAESDFILQQLLRDMPEGANEADWHTEAERLAAHIQRLGAINLAAIEEFTEQSERKAYLDAQHADLTEALATLENAIRKIDRETKERFQETFDKVNAGLQAMFPRLFGGGHAYLELIGEDILETGVTVMARPPGKRNSTIHLLSGGEKALTAVALVFSIFELNPAPFCILDEVDAPLDDANVGRFSRLLQDMSERVQFIYITHNKGTMEIAEQLVGVTMHEPGVSRLVSVDIDEAVQMAAAS
jgi:chromosome segregation protein